MERSGFLLIARSGSSLDIVPKGLTTTLVENMLLLSPDAVVCPAPLDTARLYSSKTLGNVAVGYGAYVIAGHYTSDRKELGQQT